MLSTRSLFQSTPLPLATMARGLYTFLCPIVCFFVSCWASVASMNPLRLSLVMRAEFKQRNKKKRMVLYRLLRLYNEPRSTVQLWRCAVFTISKDRYRLVRERLVIVLSYLCCLVYPLAHGTKGRHSAEEIPGDGNPTFPDVHRSFVGGGLTCLRFRNAAFL